MPQTVIVGIDHGGDRRLRECGHGAPSYARFVVREVVPESLVVEIGEGRPVGDKGMIRIPLSVVIRPGSPSANHRCSDQGPAGRIVLETGHPETPEFSIPVCVVIGP